ncbi:MAG: hypothetical protein WDZ62_00880 [Candidatus Pacearchaeota archaeon]
MENPIESFVLYFERERNRKRAKIRISRKVGGIDIYASSIDKLAEKFIKKGWKLNGEPLETLDEKEKTLFEKYGEDLLRNYIPFTRKEIEHFRESYNIIFEDSFL